MALVEEPRMDSVLISCGVQPRDNNKEPVMGLWAGGWFQGQGFRHLLKITVARELIWPSQLSPVSQGVITVCSTTLDRHQEVTLLGWRPWGTRNQKCRQAVKNKTVPLTEFLSQNGSSGSETFTLVHPSPPSALASVPRKVS